MSLIDDMNREADIDREERRHLEMMAAIIASGKIAGEIASGKGLPTSVAYLQACIDSARIIRDEQARAGTDGKANGAT